MDFEQLALAAACDARDAEHLARVDGEGDIVQTLDAKLVVSRQALDDEALCRRSSARGG